MKCNGIVLDVQKGQGIPICPDSDCFGLLGLFPLDQLQQFQNLCDRLKATCTSPEIQYINGSDFVL